MSIEKVKKYFSDFGIENRIIETSKSSATVELAALALKTEPDRIAKTLSFLISKQNETKPVLIVLSGNSRIDNAKYRHTFGCKAKMIAFDQVEPIIGHAAGGVCPFAINEGVEVYLDESLKKYETVFPAAGSGNSAIELSIAELEKYSNVKSWVNVAKTDS